MRVKTIRSLIHLGVVYHPDQEVDLADDIGDRLTADGIVAPVSDVAGIAMATVAVVDAAPSDAVTTAEPKRAARTQKRR